MAYSSITTTGNGTLKNFSFPFDYNYPTDIVVKVGGVDKPFTFTSSNTITLAVAPAAGVSVEIIRHTQIDSPEVVFAAPGALSPKLLNENTDQLLFAVQELRDDMNVTIERMNRRPYMGETPPFNPIPGDMWFDTKSATMFIYYQDIDTFQWVETNNANPGSGGDINLYLPDATGVLPISKGGTGATTKGDARVNLGISVGTTAPSSPAVGDLWVDTN